MTDSQLAYIIAYNDWLYRPDVMYNQAYLDNHYPGMKSIPFDDPEYLLAEPELPENAEEIL